MVIDGKMSLGDMAILHLFILCNDKDINASSEFDHNVPTGTKIVKKLIENQKIREIVESTSEVPFYPFRHL